MVYRSSSNLPSKKNNAYITVDMKNKIGKDKKKMNEAPTTNFKLMTKKRAEKIKTLALN